jgi:type I restriction enzyme, S subunit
MSNTVPNIDIRPDHWAIVRDILARHVPDREVWAFGSRATWTAKDYSDLDLVILGDQPLPANIRAALGEDFSESDLPYKVDVVEWAGLGDGFKEIIRRDRIVVSRNPSALVREGGNATRGARAAILNERATDGDVLQEADGDVWLPREWDIRPLSDFVDPDRSICYGVVQPGSSAVDGIPIVRVNNFVDGGVDTADALRIAPEIEAKYRRSRLQGGELLVTLVGSLGLSAIASDDLRGWNVARAVGVVPLRADVDKQWINFVIRSKPAQDFIRIRANTTVQATFNLKDLAELPISCPPDSVRTGACAALCSLDDKIELNRRMNVTLEAMARAIFKDWFVDFGPTRAKMEGRAPYLAPDIWSLFPDRLDDEGKPEGWEVSTVGDEFNLTMGQSPPGETYNETGEGLPFFQGRTDFGFRYPVRRKFCSAPTRVARADDTLVSVRAPVGDLNMAWEECCIGRGVAAVRHKRGGRSYTQYSMQFMQPAIARFEDSGSVFGAINKVQFEQLPVIAPHEANIDQFEAIAQGLDDRIRVNTAENETLAATRDFLLPKLMSGEVRIKEAEKVVGEAI